MMMRSRYEKLAKNGNDDEKLGAKAVRSRRRWVKRNGGIKGFRLSRTRKLTCASVVVLSTRIAKVCWDIFNATINTDHFSYPGFVFSTHWGLPVLSHPSVKCKRTPVISFSAHVSNL
ncbi:hypothetical protein K2173_004059 [Erythroxylum novogranatense]|uniref:Uncharacterized protein n=1 Tax=Erythroxylum novogranatense TaxID=1862640 RepID=A0AAV8SK35_9ROSI|nr:hypothetical protein K2173_004059 [Erythroxylum novogranatense]